MSAWVLTIIWGISAWGAGGYTFGNYPDEASCYKALAAMRINDQPVAESREKKSMFAFCRPKESVK